MILVSDIYIKRPVLTIVLSMLVIVFGVLGFSKLQVRVLPDIDPKIITIQTSYGGASASFMEENITTKLEKSLKNVKDVENITSTSSRGNSSIQISFKLDADINQALIDVRSQITRVSSAFPQGVSRPEVFQFDSDNYPSLWLVASSDIYTPYEVSEILKNTLISKLEKQPTVGQAKLFGERQYVVKVEPILEKLYEYKTSPQDIESAIQTQNQDYPSGIMKTGSRDFSIELYGKLKDPEHFKNIIVDTPKGQTIVSELAKVSFEPLPRTTIMKYNGKDSLAVGVVKKPSANLVEMSNAVKEILPNMQQNLSGKIDVQLAFDSSNFVRNAIKDVFITIIEAVLLVVAVILLFLKSFRSTIIPSISIPISLIGVFGLINLLGFSINLFTLLALVLSIGLVVDDAIVVLENIYRYIEKGLSPYDAAVKGFKEVGFAIIAMTLTLSSVFIPIGFIDGFIGKLFIEFAWTLALCVLISGFVSLTLTPMLSSHLIQQKAKCGGSNLIFRGFDYCFNGVEILYQQLLGWVLSNKIKFSCFCLLSILLLTFSVTMVRKALIPIEDEGFLQLYADGPTGTNLAYNARAIEEAEVILSSNKAVKNYLTILNSNSAFGFIPLKPLNERLGSGIVSEQLNRSLSQIPTMIMSSYQPSMLGGGGQGGSEAQIVLTSHVLSYEYLLKKANEIIDRMKDSRLFKEMFTNLDINSPSINVEFDREVGEKYGINIAALGNTMQAIMGESVVSYYDKGSTSYDVLFRANDNDITSLNDFGKIYIKTGNGKMINILNVAKFTNTITAKSYPHYDSMRSVTIDATLADKRDLSRSTRYLEELMKEFVSYDLSYQFIGSIEKMKQSHDQTIKIFGLSLIFIYLILSAQFESFRDAAFIMCAVPFAMLGGVISLWISGTSLNVYSAIGLVTLIGLVTKNSIMLVEFANQLCGKGKDVMDAVLSSAKLRFRPIMMTSIATMIGSVPLVLSAGAGSAAKNSIGVVILGGVGIGTLFTIFVIPMLYFVFNSNKKSK